MSVTMSVSVSVSVSVCAGAFDTLVQQLQLFKMDTIGFFSLSRSPPLPVPLPLTLPLPLPLPFPFPFALPPFSSVFLSVAGCLLHAYLQSLPLFPPLSRRISLPSFFSLSLLLSLLLSPSFFSYPTLLLSRLAQVYDACCIQLLWMTFQLMSI